MHRFAHLFRFTAAYGWAIPKPPPPGVSIRRMSPALNVREKAPDRGSASLRFREIRKLFPDAPSIPDSSPHGLHVRR
jgi:hypothetical protein